MSITAKAETLSNTITDAVNALAAETDSAKQDASFRAWLTTMSRFYTYSFGNQLLIATAMSDRHPRCRLRQVVGDEASGPKG